MVVERFSKGVTLAAAAVVSCLLLAACATSPVSQESSPVPGPVAPSPPGDEVPNAVAPFGYQDAIDQAESAVEQAEQKRLQLQKELEEAESGGYPAETAP